MMTAYERSKAFSEKNLTEIRRALTNICPSNELVITCGSYGRREASTNSDVDFYIITELEIESEDQVTIEADFTWVREAKDAIGKIVSKDPAKDGVFAKFINRSSMLHNIGGEHDTNATITRRILLLLEGDYLSNSEGLSKIRSDIIHLYIKETITDHQLALFLLNDIIRYYRTIAVDYEFKTTEASKPKPWGIRNIKLVFSRKLLYTSGLFSIAMTCDRTHKQKIRQLNHLFSMPVVERMEEICGKNRMQEVMDSYNYFLEKLEDDEVRSELDSLHKHDRGNNIFRELKNEGHHFTRKLLKLFESTFDSTHPIRRAVIF